MPSRSDYQPLRQSFDDEDEEEREEVDVGVEGRPAPAPTAEPTRSARGIRRAHHPGNIDLRKLDTAFKRCAARSSAAGLRGVDGSRSRVCVCVCVWALVARWGRWTESIAQKMKRKKKAEDVHARKEIWRSVFDPPVLPALPPTGIVSPRAPRRPEALPPLHPLDLSITHDMSPRR